MIWWWVLVFAATLLVYLPALSAGYIWDDVGHVTRSDLRSLRGLGRIWCEIGATQQYYPLLHSAFWLEYRLWGEAAGGYHLLNVLLHATNACLFAAVLRQLFGPGAAPAGHRPNSGLNYPVPTEWLAALLFALHPVCVESVAWISEQKNTLSTTFYLGAALGFLRFLSTRRRADYFLASILFVAALLTKTVTATLPAALLVILWWRQKRLEWRRDVLPLLPWFACSVVAGLVTTRFEHMLIGAQGAAFDLDLMERGLLAGRIVWFYLGKLLWPAELIFIYPRWTIDTTQWGQWLFPLAAGGLLASLAILAWRRGTRGPLAVALLFGGALFPVLGFVNIYPFLFSYVADHFQYLACLPILAMAAIGLRHFHAHFPGPIFPMVCAMPIALLGFLSFEQASTYRDKISLYEDTLAHNPGAWMARNNLATELAAAGRLSEAIPHLEEALKLRPDYAQARFNLGEVFLQLGHPDQAIPQLEEALRLRPAYAEAHNTLGAAYTSAGRTAEGRKHYEEALRIDPLLPAAHRNFGLAIAATGRHGDAIQHFARAAELDPQDGQAEWCWGIALLATARPDDAISHLERAMELAPGSAQIRLTLGSALASQSRMEEAAEQFRAAVELAPDSGEAHLLLGRALQALGSTKEAQLHFAAARRLGSGRPDRQ